MKRIYSILGAGLAVGAFALTSCDSVSEEDRLVPAEIVPQRAILLEEFTGQQCTNCPDGHQAIKDISASLGDSVVPVGIHASGLALAPMKTETGEEYYRAVGSPALPTAVIDMATSPLNVSDWGSAINHLIMVPTPFTVRAEGEVSPDGANYNIKVAFSSGTDYEGKLMVWIVENGIIARQLDHGSWKLAYEHNHVFRAAATSDAWGLPVKMKAHQPQYETFSHPISSDWDKENLYVVAFLYNDAGVAQVTSSSAGH